MNLQEHIRKVLKEETYFKISDDKYSKLIKDAVLEYVNFNVSNLTNQNCKEGKEANIFKHRLSFLVYLGKYDEIIDLQNNMIEFGTKSE